MARGRPRAASVTLLDFFPRAQRLAAEEESPPRATASAGGGDAAAAGEEEAAVGGRAPAVAAGPWQGLPVEVVTLIWAYCGPRRLCTLRQVSPGLLRLCPADHGALKRALCSWALSVVDMAALRPAGDSRVQSGGHGAEYRLGRWGDFTAATDGAGRGFVRGPALLRCNQRWRLRARASQLKYLPQVAEEVDMPLREALRCSAARMLHEEVRAALGMGGGRELPGVGGADSAAVPASLHCAGSIWDATEERPSKRRRIAEVSNGAAGVENSAPSGFFAVSRWDALMDPKVPWRLRAAALVFHHHNCRGCVHTGIRQAAADFIQSRTRQDERLRSSLLDPVDY